MMKKETIDLVENAMRQSFAADMPLPLEPSDWQQDTMAEIRMAAVREKTDVYWFSPRQEKILWRTAWAALAAVLIVAAGYFSLNNNILESDYASIAVVELEGLPY